MTLGLSTYEVKYMTVFTVTGPGSGWSRAGSISGSGVEGGYSGRWSAGGYGGDSMQDWGWGDEDAISDLIAIRRVDSRDVVYENKKKTTKVVPSTYNNC